MKKFVLILLVALAPAFLVAQNSAVEKLFDKYGGEKGFTTVTINGSLLKMAAQFSDDDDDLDVLDDINTIKILVQEDGEASNFYSVVMSELKRDSYEELMTVNTDEEDVIFLIKKSGDRISEFLLVVGGENENAIIYMGGSLSMKDLAKLSKGMHLDGDVMGHLDHLEDLDK